MSADTYTSNTLVPPFRQASGFAAQPEGFAQSSVGQPLKESSVIVLARSFDSVIPIIYSRAGDRLLKARLLRVA